MTMTLKQMVTAVQARIGVGRRKARQLVSDGAERLDFACDCEDDYQYTEQDVIDWACWVFNQEMSDGMWNLGEPDIAGAYCPVPREDGDEGPVVMLYAYRL